MFKKDKTKNLGQNKDNLINGLSKEFANEIMEKAVKENMVRIVLFNGKISYKIVERGEHNYCTRKASE